MRQNLDLGYLQVFSASIPSEENLIIISKNKWLNCEQQHPVSSNIKIIVDIRIKRSN